MILAGIAALLVMGVPYEMNQAALAELGDLESEFRPTYSFGMTYLLLAAFVTVCPSLVLSVISRTAIGYLPFFFFLLAMPIIAVASYFTVTESKTFLFVAVDIFKYLAFVCVLPILVKQSQSLLRPGYTAVFLFISAALMLYLLLQSQDDKMRLRFGMVTTATASHMAAVLVVTVLAGTGFRKMRVWHMGLLGTAAILLITGICLTGGRASFIFVTGGALLYCLIQSHRSPHLTVFALLLILSGSLLLLLVDYQSLVSVLPNEWQARLERRGGSDISAGRLEIWSAYAHYFWNNPSSVVFGIRENTFVHAMIPHNWFLGIITRHGIFVMVLLLIYYSGVVVTAWRTARIAESQAWSVIFCVLVMGLLHAMVDNALFTNGSLLSFIWLSCAGWVCYEGVGSENWQRRRTSLTVNMYTNDGVNMSMSPFL